MRPSEIRKTILEQHQELRGLLAKVDALAKRAVAGEAGCAEELRQSGRTLLDKLVAHLDLEDRSLVPAVRDADAWGEERAARLSHEHLEQRELFEYILARLRDSNRASILLGRELHAFVEALLADMEHEEQTILDEKLLRDDVIAIDAETG